MKVGVFDINGKQTGEIELDKQVFDGKINLDLLKQVIKAYLANKKHMILASAKTRGEVKGSGQKPWRQKGTGRARVGEKRNPLWRGGGVVFGPKPRLISQKIPQKLKAQALKSALNAKLKDKEVMFLERLEISEPKTKEFAKVLNNLKLAKRLLFVDKDLTVNLTRASRNIKDVEIRRASDVNAYDLLNCKKVVITKEGIDLLSERIKKVLA